MSAVNAFLKDFVDMRKTLNPQAAVKTPIDAVKDEKKKKMKMSKNPIPLDTGLQHIIEEKPGRKKVEEYFGNRISELYAKKMA